MRNQLSKNEVARIESNFDNTREAFRLLKLIDAEFRSDPMSVQCFDLRIVEAVKKCVEKRAEYLKSSAFRDED
jgi:predicted adenine nucleotide alpha hydrolase (AANH) superfamily ATPase